jgi:lipoprotein-anchoring transpeptidase ErfK/SrfK
MSTSLTASRAAAWPWLRGCCFAGLGAVLAGCTQTGATGPAASSRFLTVSAAATDAPAPARAAAGTVDPKFVKQRVRYATSHPPGTVVVDPADKFLYLVMEDGHALRYGIGVGREGFGWSGAADIRRKAAWPKWTPPAAMIARQPELEKYRRGMAGGPDNPLGARALYLFQNGKDTLYRIHGTSEADSIGENVSSGCIRLMNDDVVDLFDRIPVGAKVVVLPDRPSSMRADVTAQGRAVR